MATYPNLISEVCRTERKAELVSMAIPILIRWAQNKISNNHYGDLLKELGYESRCSFIGKILGGIHEVLNELSLKPEFRNCNIKIPSLNVLCNAKSLGLPSNGFEVVSAEYNSLSIEMKRIVVEGLIAETEKFEYWDEVLRALELKPSIVYSKTDEESVKKGGHSKYSESKFHKRLKKYIAENPKSIKISNVVKAENETILLSGDRLDVYFELKENTRIAVEVKSRISPDDDILRGIYQCIKYKAVMDAENRIHGNPFKTRAILVIEGKLSESNQQIMKSLGVEVIQEFKYELPHTKVK